MLVTWVYAALAVLLTATTIATLRPRIVGPLLAPATAITGMVVEWFVPQILAIAAAVSAVALYLGAWSSPLGRAALAAHVVCGLLLARYLQRLHRCRPVLDGRVVDDADEPFALRSTASSRGAIVSWIPSLTWRTRSMLDVEVVRGVVFREVGGVKLRLDVYRPRSRTAPLPIVMYVHGGGWVVGTRRQSRFMMYELAAAGFAVFSISYRLAPRHPLPLATEDVKAALAWVRAHAKEYDADGARVAVIGGSAGGHLAAMLALTQNDPSFQPGFEDADTSVSGAVIFYGPAELTRVFEVEPHFGWARYLEQLVFRQRFRDAPDLFRRHEPVAHVRADAPPILLVHGELDVLVPLAISRRFAEALSSAGAESVHLLEIPWAHHAFELFPTPVHQRAVRVVLRFLAWVDGRTAT
ncbi:alpha/beta hydrolase [Myxococcota bacterium]|nr:alpha/beta hydrolase [Myxococcota bacterium]